MLDTKQPGGLEMTTFQLEKGKTYQDFIDANADVDKWLKNSKVSCPGILPKSLMALLSTRLFGAR